MNKLKKGDRVVVISGKDKGIDGKILYRVNSQMLMVENVNHVKKGMKANPAKGVDSGFVTKTAPIHQSNVKIVNVNTKQSDKVCIKILGNGDKIRIYKSTGEEINNS